MNTTIYLESQLVKVTMNPQLVGSYQAVSQDHLVSVMVFLKDGFEGSIPTLCSGSAASPRDVGIRDFDTRSF